mmetsp:Transcript_19047/g.34455  ORF Transcript_19047/g.34455 Transcript_19047/m.34455 type:complete len:233 (+) Transcript_19047:1308-2006(+)
MLLLPRQRKLPALRSWSHLHQGPSTALGHCLQWTRLLIQQLAELGWLVPLEAAPSREGPLQRASHGRTQHPLLRSVVCWSSRSAEAAVVLLAVLCAIVLALQLANLVDVPSQAMAVNPTAAQAHLGEAQQSFASSRFSTMVPPALLVGQLGVEATAAQLEPPRSWEVPKPKDECHQGQTALVQLAVLTSLAAPPLRRLSHQHCTCCTLSGIRTPPGQHTSAAGDRPWKHSQF